MDQLSLVDIKVLELIFKREAVPTFGSKDQLRATHVIIDNIFKGRYHSCLIYDVQVDFIICCYRDLSVAFDVVDEASHVQLVKLYPTLAFLKFIVFLLK
jgi:hypothetical protein